ncbi:hypothetical protein [Streptomyces sp. SID3343]|uniref:hypothetical protein n=1 Tax=Streptomyces sp. SID3343 TaxID=2690260 RepID=UPI00137037DC|nr:hypothetical protein [Streptomyces sp. SID3343]MYW04256.1 hypothetical protein [Streptomyces sp. SID3343]
MTDAERAGADRERWTEALRRIDDIFAAALGSLVAAGDVPGTPVVRFVPAWHGVTSRLTVVDRHWQLGPLRLDSRGGLYAGDPVPVEHCWNEHSFYRSGDLQSCCRKNNLTPTTLVARWTEPAPRDLPQAVHLDRVATHIHATSNGTPVVHDTDGTRLPLETVVVRAVADLTARG